MIVEFESFVEMVGPRLRAALVAAYGEDTGLDAAAEALAYAWEHWERLRPMQNPAGYLYRVGQSAAKRLHQRPTLLPVPPASRLPDFEPGLLPALDELSESQRVCVVLVHAFAWRQVDVAELLEIESATVRTHLSRGIRKLQYALEGEAHVQS
jgi:RNA polymerase sigma-70 factor (ECF subfamily)